MAGKRAGAKANSTDDRQLFSLRLPRALHTQLGVLARVRGQRLNELIVEVLQHHWEDVPERPAVEKLLQTSVRAAPSARTTGDE